MTMLIKRNIIMLMKKTELMAVMKNIEEKKMTLFKMEILNMQEDGMKNKQIANLINENIILKREIKEKQISEWIRLNQSPNYEIIEFLEKRFLERIIRETEKSEKENKI